MYCLCPALIPALMPSILTSRSPPCPAGITGVYDLTSGSRTAVWLFSILWYLWPVRYFFYYRFISCGPSDTVSCPLSAAALAPTHCGGVDGTYASNSVFYVNMVGQGALLMVCCNVAYLMTVLKAVDTKAHREQRDKIPLPNPELTTGTSDGKMACFKSFMHGFEYKQRTFVDQPSEKCQICALLWSLLFPTVDPMADCCCSPFCHRNGSGLRQAGLVRRHSSANRPPQRHRSVVAAEPVQLRAGTAARVMVHGVQHVYLVCRACGVDVRSHAYR